MAQGLTTTKGVDGIQLALNLDDAGSGITYVGEATPGSVNSAAVWRIKRLDETVADDLTILWADGNASFDNVWNDRAGLSYS